MRENAIDVTIHSVTKGGRKLFENLQQNDENSEKITELLDENLYDILFLQEQSYLPAVNYEVFEDGVRRLKEKVLAKQTILITTHIPRIAERIIVSSKICINLIT